ncbi:MAG: hypothetical protein K6E44_02075 [Bacteroidales bacterium]|nr:hypothetical protein [Bacteroidales bacterium]
MSKVIDKLESIMNQKCLDLGFTKSKMWYKRPSSTESFFDLLYIYYSDYGRNKQIWIAAGKHNSDVERIYNKLSNKQYSESYSLKGIRPVLIDKCHSITKLSDIPEVVNNIIDVFNTECCDFYNYYNSIERIIDSYENDTTDQFHYFFILPILYAMIGKHEKGIEVMESLQKYGIVNNEDSRFFFNNFINSPDIPLLTTSNVSQYFL